MMKCFIMSIKSKFSREHFLTLWTLELIVFSLTMNSLLMSLHIRLSFESGAAYVTIDARQSRKILHILKIYFSSKMLLSLVAHIYVFPRKCYATFWTIEFGFSRTIIFAMNSSSMPWQSLLRWKLKPTKITVEFSDYFLMFGIFVVAKSIAVAVSLVTQVTFEHLLFPLMNVFLVFSSCSYSKESLEAKRAGPIFLALKVPVFTSIVYFCLNFPLLEVLQFLSTEPAPCVEN